MVASAAVKYWEIIADNLAKHGWSWGLGSISAGDGMTIFVADAQQDDGKRLVVRGHELLAVFVELEERALRSDRFPRRMD